MLPTFDSDMSSTQQAQTADVAAALPFISRGRSPGSRAVEDIRQRVILAQTDEHSTKCADQQLRPQAGRETRVPFNFNSLPLKVPGCQSKDKEKTESLSRHDFRKILNRLQDDVSNLPDFALFTSRPEKDSEAQDEPKSQIKSTFKLQHTQSRRQARTLLQTICQSEAAGQHSRVICMRDVTTIIREPESEA